MGWNFVKTLRFIEEKYKKIKKQEQEMKKQQRKHKKR